MAARDVTSQNSSHPNGTASIREVHQLLDDLEERMATRLSGTEQRVCAKLDDHRREHDRASRGGLQVLTIVVASLAMLLSTFLGVLQLVA